MARTTVVGYDGSGAAVAAMRCAARRAADGARLVVAHAAKVPTEFLETPYYEKSLEHARERAATVLDQAGAELPGDTTVETAVLSGPPAQALVQLARELDAAEIAVGSRGFGPWRAAALGSTSHALLHESDLPVLVVPRRAVETEARRAGAEQQDYRRVIEIVLGSRGRGRFRAALGSVSHALLHEADLPVVVVPGAPRN